MVDDFTESVYLCVLLLLPLDGFSTVDNYMEGDIYIYSYIQIYTYKYTHKYDAGDLGGDMR